MKAGSSFLGLILGVLMISAVKAEYDDLCVRFADNVQFREPGNCKAYVTCKNGVGTVTACPDNQLYDKDSTKCVSASKVTDSYCDPLCNSDTESKFVTDPLSCNGYYYCRNSEPLYGVCYEGYNFNEEEQLCDYPSDFPCNGVPDFCKILKNGVKFSDPEACDKYYECSKSVQKSSTCATDKYYDVASATCLSKYNVTCDVHPYPKDVCGKNAKPTVNQPVSDGVTCRGYFYCAYKGPNLADPNPVWYQCPEGTFFDKTKKSCGDPTLISCIGNRCDGRGNSLVLAENEYCQHYHVCEDGKDTGLQKCPRDMFFSESLQACVYDELSYPICDT